MTLYRLAHTLIGILILFSASSAWAQRIQPMTYELAPLGAKSSTVLSVQNTSARDVAFEVSAKKMFIDAEGNETRQLSEDDFLLFPPQFLLSAGKTQAVRVKYIGDPTIKNSVPYRIAVAQLPLASEDVESAAVGMRFVFNTLAHVTPKSAKVDPQVTKITENPDGTWAIKIVNHGQKMARLSRRGWRVTDGSKTTTFSSKEVSSMLKKSLVMPGKSINVTIPAIEGFKAEATSIGIHVRP